MITALMVKPGEQPCVVSLVDDIDFLNAAVSIGATLMCKAGLLPIEQGVVAIYAWDGVVAGLQGNRKVGKRIIAGTFYVIRIVNGELHSLSRDEITKFSYQFRRIQDYDEQEVIESWLDSLLLED